MQPSPPPLDEFQRCGDPLGVDERKQGSTLLYKRRVEEILSKVTPPTRQGGAPIITIVAEDLRIESEIKFILSPTALEHEAAIRKAVVAKYDAAVWQVNRSDEFIDDTRGTATTLTIVVYREIDLAYLRQSMPRTLTGWLRLAGWVTLLLVAGFLLYLIVVPVRDATVGPAPLGDSLAVVPMQPSGAPRYTLDEVLRPPTDMPPRKV